MELMSSLLLYAVVILLTPQAFGRSSIKVTYNSGFNDSVIIKKRPFMGQNILVNVHSPVMISKVSDLQSVFMDPTCRGCFGCMERSIKAHKVHNQKKNLQNIQKELSIQDRTKRDKRKVNIEKAVSKHENRGKKPKSKMNNKSVTIIKYNDKDKVYALKIKETYSHILEHNTSKTISSCEVYSVQKSSPCDSQEAEFILSASKKKMNKKHKKEQTKRETTVSEVKATVIAPIFRKRQIDNSQVPEHIMTSVEEIY